MHQETSGIRRQQSQQFAEHAATQLIITHACMHVHRYYIAICNYEIVSKLH